MNNAINEKSSERKPQPVQAGVTAGQDKPSQPQQQGKFSQQHDAEKSKAAAPADKGKKKLSTVQLIPEEFYAAQAVG